MLIISFYNISVRQELFTFSSVIIIWGCVNLKLIVFVFENGYFIHKKSQIIISNFLWLSLSACQPGFDHKSYFFFGKYRQQWPQLNAFFSGWYSDLNIRYLLKRSYGFNSFIYYLSACFLLFSLGLLGPGSLAFMGGGPCRRRIWTIWYILANSMKYSVTSWKQILRPNENTFNVFFHFRLF